MSNNVRGKHDALFDPLTGRFVGVVDNAGKEQEIVTPKRVLAQTLAAAFEAEQRAVNAFGQYLLPRTGLAAADTPTITASSTAPSADADAAAQTIPLSATARGTTVLNPLPGADMEILNRWIFGHNPALSVNYYGQYAASNTIAGNATIAGNQAYAGTERDATTGYGISNNTTYFEGMLNGDVLFMLCYNAVANTTKFQIWVNDHLIGQVASAPGTGASCDSTGYLYGPSGTSTQYLKIKFPSVGLRKIRIAVTGKGGIGDMYIRAAHTLWPSMPTDKRIKWLHIGDSMGAGTGASPTANNIPAWTASQFGTSIALVNASVTSVGYGYPTATSFSMLQRWDIDLKYLPAQDIVTIDLGHNDGSPGGAAYIAALRANVYALLAKINAAWPNCLVIVAGVDPGLDIVSTGVDLQVEDAVSAAVASANAYLIPVQRDTRKAWLFGTGKVGATTGDGNSDLFTANDGIHPSPAGHQYFGTRLAREVYTICQRVAVGA